MIANDGRIKYMPTPEQIAAECAKIREEKKRKNPKYGTIFNIGELFK